MVINRPIGQRLKRESNEVPRSFCERISRTTLSTETLSCFKITKDIKCSLINDTNIRICYVSRIPRRNIVKCRYILEQSNS